MDRVDIRLLGQLARGFSSHGFQPDVKGVYGRIAENLGLDEDTIRKRVDRLEASGIIRRWQLAINPNVLGLRLFAVWMTVSPQLKIDEAVRKIRLVPGVISIARMVGDLLGVGLLCEDEQVFRKRIELISEFADPRELTTYAVSHPSTSVEITETDWQIIRALRPNPLIRYNELAEKLGLSSKTVQRRLSRLTEANVIFFIPYVDFSRLEGVTCADIFVIYTASSYKTEVDRSIYSKFEDYVFRAGWGSRNHGHFEFLVPNVGVAQEIVDWARGLEGVREVKLNFVYDWPNYFDEVSDELIPGKAAMSSVR